MNAHQILPVTPVLSGAHRRAHNLLQRTASRIPGVKPHDRDELLLIIIDGPMEELDSFVSRDLLGNDPWENFFLDKFLVFVGVREFRPSVPNSSNHEIIHLRFENDVPNVTVEQQRGLKPRPHQKPKISIKSKMFLSLLGSPLSA